MMPSTLLGHWKFQDPNISKFLSEQGNRLEKNTGPFLLHQLFSPSFTGSLLDIGQDTFKFCFVAKKLALQQVHPSVYNLNPQLWWLQIPLWGAVVNPRKLRDYMYIYIHIESL